MGRTLLVTLVAALAFLLVAQDPFPVPPTPTPGPTPFPSPPPGPDAGGL